MAKSKAQEHREKIKSEFWPNEIPWTGDGERGWFRAPRSLPLILMMLSSKEISENQDPTRVYLELLARHRDTGVVDMVSEGEHSYAAGYSGTRGVRTWQERMKLLEKLGFIKSLANGNQPRKYVLLIHPALAVKKLYDDGKIDEDWWATYRQCQIGTKETRYEDFDFEDEEEEKVVDIGTAKKRRKKAVPA